MIIETKFNLGDKVMFDSVWMKDKIGTIDGIATTTKKNKVEISYYINCPSCKSQIFRDGIALARECEIRNLILEETKMAKGKKKPVKKPGKPC